MKNIFMLWVSSVDEVFIPLEHTPDWIYWLIASGVAFAVISAAVIISKKVK